MILTTKDEFFAKKDQSKVLLKKILTWQRWVGSELCFIPTYTEGGWAITSIAPKASSVHLCGIFEMGSWKEFWKFHTYIYIVDSLNLVQVGFTTASNHGP
jgi:hypothetical protein